MDCCGNKTKWYKKLLSIVLGLESSDRSNLGKKVVKLDKIVLVGSPNVGKSVLFNTLTGAYVTVSNYPGTTVEVARGKGNIGGIDFEIVDTPGMYSLTCITEEEKVTRDLLLEEHPRLLIHVIDAKNINRMLPLTLQFIEGGLPVMLVLNIMDEAESLGLDIDVKGLEKELGIPVIPTIAALKKGIEELKTRIGELIDAA